MLVDIDIIPLLSKTEAFLNTMYYVEIDLSLKPQKQHIATCIKYSGLIQLRGNFIRQLTNSVIKYVYSGAKQTQILEELTTGNDAVDESDAITELYQQACQYFRPSDIHGQFSELLLFNFLQHHFKALPVVRKMTITTNPAVERNGADAIHLAKVNPGEYIVYLGEAKTYTSGFKKAFQSALKSIITAYNEHRKELQLYNYSEFLEEPVRELMKDYLKCKIDLPVKLVVIISYCTGNTPNKTNAEDFHKHYIEDAVKECQKIVDADYANINEGLLPQLHYIIFPVDELAKLLDDFKLKLGIKP